MKAMVLTRFGRVAENSLELRNVPVPRPGPEEILVKVAYCGVCHTDLHTAEGDLPDIKLPRIPGHEVIGTVEERGGRAKRFKVGERVGAAWLYWACGICRFCKSGKENLCESARFTGFHHDGGYAEYIAVPEKFAYAVPRVFGDAEAAPLMCAGIVGYRSLKLSGIKAGGRLGLYGFGASAHVAIQIARHWGCRVYVFTRSEEHKRLAKKLGASWTGLAKDDPPAKLDSAIIFAPAGSFFLDALRALERGGTAVSAGIYMSPIPQMDYGRYLYHERKMLSVANATREDGEELLKVAAEIPIRTTVQVFPLEHANEALRLLRVGKVTGAAVLKVS
ncbi:MAG: zinc-dependent alcohol dehydrogenase family protein [Candidatus Aminicenantales bacterium]